MTHVEMVAVALFGVGLTMLFSELRFFARVPLVQRLRPYGPAVAGARVPVSHSGVMSAVLLPVASSLGESLGRAVGLDTDLSLRLRRAGSHDDPTSFRLRQFTRAMIALACATAAVMLLRPAALLALLAVIGTPVLVALGEEQRLDRAASEREETVRAELPVVAEQLGVLLGAGFSLGSAIARMAERCSGAVSDDLDTVRRRIRQGLTEIEALREWADASDIDAVQRLVRVLVLHRETADLGALISDESRALRADSHRRLVESLERRSQMVWIPVTVATLIPGLIMLAVPFVAAMDRVTG